MFKEPIFLDPESGNAFLIINYPSGVKYEAQIGGMSCSHITMEGLCFLVSANRGLGLFEDCAYLCWDSEDLSKRNACIPVLNDFLKKMSGGHFGVEYLLWEYSKHLKDIEIDKSRVEELTEGCWPIKGMILDVINEYIPFTGYIITENCD